MASPWASGVGGGDKGDGCAGGRDTGARGLPLGDLICGELYHQDHVTDKARRFPVHSSQACITFCIRGGRVRAAGLPLG